MESNSQDKKQKKAGRKPKNNPSNFRYTVNMDADENARFQSMLLQSEADSISGFILDALFAREIKVVKIDKATMDYYIRLTNFYAQFRAVGVNYTQVVKVLKRKNQNPRLFFQKVGRLF